MSAELADRVQAGTRSTTVAHRGKLAARMGRAYYLQKQTSSYHLVVANFPFEALRQADGSENLQ
jgi:hypothetical protein